MCLQFLASQPLTILADSSVLQAIVHFLKHLHKKNIQLLKNEHFWTFLLLHTSWSLLFSKWITLSRYITNIHQLTLELPLSLGFLLCEKVSPFDPVFRYLWPKPSWVIQDETWHFCCLSRKTEVLLPLMWLIKWDVTLVLLTSIREAAIRMSYQGSCDQVTPPAPRHESLRHCQGGVSETPQELCMHPRLDLHYTQTEKGFKWE